MNYNNPSSIRRQTFGKKPYVLYGKPTGYGSSKQQMNENGSSSTVIKQPFGSAKFIPEEKASSDMIFKMAKCNTLTISTVKQPEYYLKLIRHHFKES